MNLPGWLTKGMSVPVLKWVLGAFAILVIGLILTFKAMLNYKRRFEVARKLRAVEKSYYDAADKLEKDEENQLADLKIVHDEKVAELKEKSDKIDEAANNGAEALAHMINLTFKGKSK